MKRTEKKKKATKKAQTKSAPRNNKKVEKTKPIAKKHRKVPKGRTLLTRDNHLDKNAKKPNKKRPLIVVEVNDKNELAVIALSTQKGKNRSELKSYNAKGLKGKDGKEKKTYYKHFIEIEDSEGKPIKVGIKFNENPPFLDIKEKELKSIIDKVFYHATPSPDNQKKLKKFKKR